MTLFDGLSTTGQRIFIGGTIAFALFVVMAFLLILVL